MIKLYDYWRSSASYRVRIALGLANLEWETEIVNLLDGDHKSDTHLARNPQGLVPALEIDGLMMTQSVAVIEYLDETRSLGLLPQAPADRAKVRALAFAVAMEIHPVCNLNVVKFAVSQSNENIETKQWMQHFITKGLVALENMLDGSKYCFGETVTLADICLMPQLYNAERWGVDLTKMPKIRAVSAELAKLPAFDQAHPDQSPH